MPRTVPAVERATADGRFELADGPFEHYRRTVQVEAHPDGTSTVTQRVDFTLAVPFWGRLFVPLVRRSLARPHRPGHVPWWLPPEVLDARASAALARLTLFSVLAGYLGVLLSQTNTYFKEEFGATNTEISYVLTAVRVGGLVALGISALADRRGRRRILLLSSYAGILLAATGALAPGLVWLGLSQTLARSFSAAIALVVAIMAAEEMPSGSRAFAVSMLTMTAGLGAGGVVLFLQVAEAAPWAWRLFYLVPLVALPVVHRLGRRLPETRRFEIHEIAAEVQDPATVPDGDRREHRRRFVLLGVSGLLFAVFFTPAAAYLNEYLRTEQGFDGLRISLLQTLTNLPGGLAIVVGGRLADQYGRRVVGAIGMTAGVGFTVAMYASSGWPVWAFSTLATLLGAIAVPALGVYGPELFPTASRGLANGALNLLAVAGSVIGLLVAAALADRWGSYSPAMAVLALAPALVVVLVLTRYPETAHRALEELNPEDVAPPQGDAREEALAALDEAFARHEHDRTDRHRTPKGHR